MYKEQIKNLALDRISSHRRVMTYTPEKPDVRVVAQNNSVPAPAKPKDHARAREQRNTWRMIGIAVGVAILLVVAVRAKWIKL